MERLSSQTPERIALKALPQKTLRLGLTALFILVGSVAFAAGADDGAVPRSTDARVVIELFAEQPQVVTPTGVAVDGKGRVFVAESHTHFRPDDYDGPAADRILIFEDTDGDGKADRRSIFHEGFTHVMDIEFHYDGSLYVATRKDIHRMRDTDGDSRADDVRRIIHLETTGDYPHNGISGLAFHLDGRLNFGLGENLGADYTVVGTDGTRISGGGEGGSTYRVNADGAKLRRVSTGWWNPFGMCVDGFDRVFGTDNDPGASPPCRLHQVIDGGDYGYEYRYGRTGLHPLISWTGAAPGVLPMISGTGEAPCAVLAYESDALPEKYLGRLLVASWADHRIEHYRIEGPKDAGLTQTRREVLIEGHNEFRPVDLAIAPDGSVYVTDWVSSSYSLHKKGRIWRIRPKSFTPNPRPSDLERALLSRHRPLREHAARQLAGSFRGRIDERLAKFSDPRVRAAVMRSLADSGNNLEGLDSWIASESDARLRRLGVSILAERGEDVSRWADDAEKSVRAAAIPYLNVKEHAGRLATAVDDGDPLLFHAAVMALSHSGAENVRKFSHDHPAAGLLAMKRAKIISPAEAPGRLAAFLEAKDPDVRYLAVKWIADEEIATMRPNLIAMLGRPELDYRSFRAVVAAIDRLDGKKPTDNPSAPFLLDQINGKRTSPAVLGLSLRLIDPSYKKLTLQYLAAHLRHKDIGVRLEAVRTLAAHPDEGRWNRLMRLAEEALQPEEIRAATLAGLAGGPPATVEFLLARAVGRPSVLRDEALRSLVGVELTDAQKKRLRASAVGPLSLAMRRLLRGSVGPRPKPGDVKRWSQLLRGEGDPSAGERIFFGKTVGVCSRCHQIDGRGTAVGPSLTQMDRRLQSQGPRATEWLLETILLPSKDMAPQYTPWIIVTTDGKTLTGLPRRKGGKSEAYLGVDGKEFSVKKEDIEFHQESGTSIMPQDLLKNLTDQEIRDLFAFLKQPR